MILSSIVYISPIRDFSFRHQKVYKFVDVSHTMHREPANEWPDKPLSKDQARDLLESEEDIIAVWVMDNDSGTREAVLETNHPHDTIIDIILEKKTAYDMFSYTDYENRLMWVSFGDEKKGTERGKQMEGTLESYDLLAGKSDVS